MKDDRFCEKGIFFINLSSKRLTRSTDGDTKRGVKNHVIFGALFGVRNRSCLQ